MLSSAAQWGWFPMAGGARPRSSHSSVPPGMFLELSPVTHSRYPQNLFLAESKFDLGKQESLRARYGE